MGVANYGLVRTVSQKKRKKKKKSRNNLQIMQHGHKYIINKNYSEMLVIWNSRVNIMCKP